MDAQRPTRRSIRLRGYDYAQPGGYFVTIATMGREPVFGEVQGEQIRLSPAGDVVCRVWTSLPERYPPVAIDEFVVMPDHIHGIVFLSGDAGAMNRAPPLGAVVRAFKAASTWRLHRSGYPQFAWQRNYYEHVIRSEGDLTRVREYIRNNPAVYAATGGEPPPA